MNIPADKAQTDKKRAVSNTGPVRQSKDTSAFQLTDNRPEAIAQRKLQAVAHSSAQVQRMNTFQRVANAADKQTGATLQRYPLALDEVNDNDQNPGIYTDSKHDWMRMQYRDDLGADTFELLNPNGTPSGSFMIHEYEYDQYRFSMDGREISGAFPPHFMEELNGDAQIADDIEDPLRAYVGEYGVGFRPAKGVHATIEMSGMISCIGFILRSESAVFACHMVVTEGVPREEGPLKQQVNVLASKYEYYAGEMPEHCELLYDQSQYGTTPPHWLNWLLPDGIREVYRHPAREVKETVTGRMDDAPTVMWRGDPIQYARAHEENPEEDYSDYDDRSDYDDPQLDDEEIDRALYEHEKWSDF